MCKRVVVVEDSRILAKQICLFFEQELGYTVLACGENGDEAVELYTQYTPDLITLDITMPGKDGLEALREIVSHDSAAKVLMISGVRRNAMLECMSLGAAGYIEKPLRFREPEYIREFKETVDEIFS
jgi:two-component system chemotaxis response regulator CheY